MYRKCRLATVASVGLTLILHQREIEPGLTYKQTDATAKRVKVSRGTQRPIVTQNTFQLHLNKLLPMITGSK